MDDTNKYLVVFPIPEPWRSKICLLMDKIADYTGLPAPYIHIEPHVTFYRPIMGIDREVIENLIQSSVLQVRQTRLVVSGLFPFGKHYIVLPVHGTLGLASVWVELYRLLSGIPEFRHGEFDTENTLHISVALKTTSVFDRVWPLIRRIPVEPLAIPVTCVDLYQKSLVDCSARWEKIRTFEIPK